MSRYYKLIDAIETPTTLNVARLQNGITKYGHIRLDPGKKYELDEDRIFISSLKNAKVQKRYSKELAERLDTFQIPYEETICKSCGGRIKKLSYAVVEVVE